MSFVSPRIQSSAVNNIIYYAVKLFITNVWDKNFKNKRFIILLGDGGICICLM